jgi:hypothetical protein
MRTIRIEGAGRSIVIAPGFVGVWVADGVRVIVDVSVGPAVGVSVEVGVGVEVDVGVSVGEGVGVGVKVSVGGGSGVRVRVGVGVAVDVAVGVGVVIPLSPQAWRRIKRSLESMTPSRLWSSRKSGGGICASPG